MAKCNHLNGKLNVQLTRWVDAVLVEADYDRQITRDAYVSIRVQAFCSDCGFVGTYNAYNPAICAELQGAGAHAVDHWPTWLLDRMIPLRTMHAAVQDACLACGVLPRPAR